MLKESYQKDQQNQNFNNEVKALKKEIIRLKKTLEEYGADEYSVLTDVEYICIKGIEDLKILADGPGLTQDDAKVLDLLHKNLRMARGQFDKKEPKGKASSLENLLKIVEGNNK